ncbi:MAG TPA: YeaH/YhbH family protein [Vitreimonas sp.]|uniref:YeaH/YhbH family protein n=1 Tax=Vitreimonas sp. TaxID=3069702 RepID=UPI002D348A66|nr:YeaH/YhbH family protein [Vitreimonas sp.]HYD87349.1 YeaH/YhbH family protein [Vitreimonas sp.]
MHIIDRRLNPGGKSFANRQRFLRRARAQVRKAVREASSSRSIKDAGKGGEISIPTGGVHEPHLHRSREGGVRDYVLPGNKKYIEGDTIPRPEQGGGQGSQASDSGEGEDEFRFALSDEEYLDLYLEDLELPDLAKRQVAGAKAVLWRQAGYSVSGPPSRISVPRTLRHSMSRRIALKRPKADEINALRAEIEKLEREGGHFDELQTLRTQLEQYLARSKRIPYIDPVDVRYRRLESNPKPIARAVMFCLMDVSGSMNEHMKDLAKRFYSLLYLFLNRRYEHVDVVFIRHTHEAQEVDEQTFFYSRETGGTVVSTALFKMAEIVRDRYPVDQWNIYAAQASDGDNTSSDNAVVLAQLKDVILPICQYYAYVEVGMDDEDDHPGAGEPSTNLWRAYRRVAVDAPFAMRKVRHRRDIYPVFRELFARRPEGVAAEGG